MNKTYHILNGDGLFQQFPENILGEKLVCREALIEGSTDSYREGDSLEEFFVLRKAYLTKAYGSRPDYDSEVLSAFQEMQNISNGADVYLWFGRDLFCQINLWFVLSLLKEVRVYLVFPSFHSQEEYCFGGMNEFFFGAALAAKIKVSGSKLTEMKKLWPTYQKGNQSKMEAIAANLRQRFPMFLEATKANERRTNGNLATSAKQIFEQSDINNFSTFFKEFSKQEAIFGLGDSQVKQYYDALIQEN